MKKFLVFNLLISSAGILADGASSSTASTVATESPKVDTNAVSKFQSLKTQIKDKYAEVASGVSNNRDEILYGTSFVAGLADGYNSKLVTHRNKKGSKIQFGFPIAALINSIALSGEYKKGSSVLSVAATSLLSYYLGNQAGKFSNSAKKMILNR